jgi:hypothetical protein
MPLHVKNHTISSNDITSLGVLDTKVNRDGLILHLDAADIDSYPGSGSIWYDLSNTSNDTTISGPTWTTVGGRTAFNFTSSGNVITKSGFNSFPSTELTYEVWLYPATSEITGDDRGCVILVSGGSGAYMSWNKSNRYMSNYWYGHSPEGYHETNGPSARGAWHHWCSVWDNRGVHQWVDGTYNVAKDVRGTSTPNTFLQIGNEGGGRQFSGAIAVVRIYNRALNGYEVYENFQAQRGRFGL